MQTTQKLYQNEVRAIQITLYDNKHIAFSPSTAYYSVVNDEGTIIASETMATLSENILQGVINTTVTENVGTYFIVWRILKSGSTYYHKTRLNVVTLLPD